MVECSVMLSCDESHRESLLSRSHLPAFLQAQTAGRSNSSQAQTAGESAPTQDQSPGQEDAAQDIAGAPELDNSLATTSAVDAEGETVGKLEHKNKCNSTFSHI